MAPHDLLPVEFALLRILLDREECTTTQLAQMLPVTASPHKPHRDQAGRQGPHSQAAAARRPPRREAVADLKGEGADAGASPARAGIRREAHGQRQRGGDGGLRFRPPPRSWQTTPPWRTWSRAVIQLNRPSRLPLLAVLLALCIAGGLLASPALPAHAQSDEAPLVSFEPASTRVFEGTQAAFTLTRTREYCRNADRDRQHRGTEPP